MLLPRGGVHRSTLAMTGSISDIGRVKKRRRRHTIEPRSSWEPTELI